MTEIEKKFELIKPNLEWLFGMSLNVPDEVFLEERIYNGLESKPTKIHCNISNNFWDENKPIYCFICDYESGEKEIVKIPLLEILERLNDYHNLRITGDFDLYIDSIEFVVRCCISDKLKLIN